VMASDTVPIVWSGTIQWGFSYNHVTGVTTPANFINIPRATTGIGGLALSEAGNVILNSDAAYSTEVFVQIHPF